MPRTLKAPVVIALAALLSFPAVRAEEVEGATEAPPDAPGGYIGGRVGYLEVEGVDGGSLNVGFLAGYAFQKALALEGSLDYHTADYGSNGRETVALQASVCVYPFSGRGRPRLYAVGGVGVYYSDYEITEEGYTPTDTREWDAGYHAGVGIDVPIGLMDDTPDSLLTIDVRYLFTREERDDPQRIEPDGILATIGLKFRF